MTKKQLLEQIKDMSDDSIICNQINCYDLNNTSVINSEFSTIITVQNIQADYLDGETGETIDGNIIAFNDARVKFV
jgi:hypothetical protein